MSESTQTAPDELAEQVRDLFADARTVLPTDGSTADGSEPADRLSDDERTKARDLGGLAADLLETSDPRALLAALGMGGSGDPGSIPAAILAGEPDDVADLRVLLALSRLAPDEDGDGPFDEPEREAMATLADLLDDESTGETETAEPIDDDAEPPDGEAGGADGENGDEEADTGASDDETDAAAESGDDSDEITATLQDALTDVRSGLGDAFGGDGDAAESGEESGDGGIAEAAGDVVDEAGDRIADAATGQDDGGSGDATAKDADEGDGDSEDDDLLGLGDEGELLDSDEDGDILGGDDGETLAGGDAAHAGEAASSDGRTKHSTIPSQDRADMSGVRRYSTMPDR